MSQKTVEVKSETHRTRSDNATFFFSFWKRPKFRFGDNFIRRVVENLDISEISVYRYD